MWYFDRRFAGKIHLESTSPDHKAFACRAGARDVRSISVNQKAARICATGSDCRGRGSTGVSSGDKAACACVCWYVALHT